jgi:tRNA(Arg) A34 adenosine deaminase TadA
MSQTSAAATMDDHKPETIISTLLSLTETTLIPLTREAVSSGSKVFGASILASSSSSSSSSSNSTLLTPVLSATNNESASPLLHAEINCLTQFFTLPKSDRQDVRVRDCLFFATHEPCSLCISGIVWSGFSRVVYLFGYGESRDLHGIPYDIEILEEVFRVRAEGETDEQLERRPLYNRTNKFCTLSSVAELVATIEDGDERERWEGEVVRVKKLYDELSETYQRGKAAGQETESFFK